MQKSTFRRDDLYSQEWVLCFNMDFHTCINLMKDDLEDPERDVASRLEVKSRESILIITQ